MQKLVRFFDKTAVWIAMLSMMLCMLQPAVIAHATETDAAGSSVGFTDYNEEAYGSYEEALNASLSATELQGDELVDEADSVEVSSDIVRCSSPAAASSYVRENMVARKSTIRFFATYITPNRDVENYSRSERYEAEKELSRVENWIKEDYYDNVRPQIFKFTGNYKEGDYLLWNWGGTQVNYDIYNDGVLFTYEVSYLSSAYQEKSIDAEVSRLLSNEFAGWEKMHNYEKVRMVYKWMTSTFKYVEGEDNHSTYSAIIRHKTVCQGFATAMYRLLGEMGLSVRMIASDTHGWNIVQLGRNWYSLDATWDVGRSEANWDYFLPAEIDFVLDDHFRSPEYDTEEFHEMYPMSWWEPYDYASERDYVGVDYRTHVQSYGWQNFVYDGAMSGTSGESKRLEAIELKLDNLGEYDLGIEYRTHIQGYGWESQWKKDGQLSGTSGESRRLEAIQIRLTGSDAAEFDVYYRVHAQNYGWLGWAKNGQEAGTAGQSKRLEGIQVVVVPKWDYIDGILGYSYVDMGTRSTSENATAGLVNYRTHVQTYGWQGYVYDGSISGTSGESKRLEGINISLGDTGYEGGIRYTTHVQNYGWQGDKDAPETWPKDGEMAGTSGESKRLEGIRIELYGEVADHYDVYYRVHAQTYGWLDWAVNGQDAGTAGLSKRLEAIQIVVLPKVSDAPGSMATPFISN
ncbi:MAG: hypothetical protein J6A59_01610 [Lachnospiraceae bacterium]|nr:hypothetical protein [Lachnospiraceae bacterium]